MSLDWTSVCDFKPWEAPSTYALVLLTLMLIYTLSVWSERKITFRGEAGSSSRLYLARGSVGAKRSSS